jgi:protein SCO1/2
MKQTLILLLVLCLLQCCKQKTESSQKVPYYNSADFTPIWNISLQQRDTLHSVGAFSLTDQYGKPFTRDSIKGRICLADFFFTRCPSICPKMTRNMRTIYEQFKNDRKVMFLSHSVTPELDSPVVLYRYAKEKDILSPQWRLLTGPKSIIYDLARRQYYIEEADGLNKDSTQFLHTEKFVLIDGNGNLRGLYNGTLRSETERIAEDIRALEQEK